MLPACFRNRALRLLNHTWNTKTFCVSTVNSFVVHPYLIIYSLKRRIQLKFSSFRTAKMAQWPFQAFDIMLDEKGEERKTKFENL